jgi:hypothetical protein
MCRGTNAKTSKRTNTDTAHLNLFCWLETLDVDVHRSQSCHFKGAARAQGGGGGGFPYPNLRHPNQLPSYRGYAYCTRNYAAGVRVEAFERKPMEGGSNPIHIQSSWD